MWLNGCLARELRNASGLGLRFFQLPDRLQEIRHGHTRGGSDSRSLPRSLPPLNCSLLFFALGVGWHISKKASVKEAQDSPVSFANTTLAQHQLFSRFKNSLPAT